MSLIHGFKVARTLSPSDTTDFGVPYEGFIVAAAGNAVVVPVDGSATITFTGLLVGSHIPIKFRRVNATNTTATLIGVWGQ
jgi:hypothetical protein